MNKIEVNEYENTSHTNKLLKVYLWGVKWLVQWC